MKLGNKCLTRMWVDDAPQSFAARIYSWLLSLSKWVLTLLARVGHEINPSKQDIKKKRNSELHSNGAKAARHINKGIGGTVRIASVNICNTLSIQPP